jgi:hypothetical protein
MYVQVIASNLNEEEIKGLKQMFMNMDTDNSGTITYEELKAGLAKLGSKLSEAEVKQLMEAVCSNLQLSYCALGILFLASLHAYLLAFSRLMLMGMDPLTMLSSSLPQCIDTSWNETSICSRHSSTLIKITVGEYFKLTPNKC